MKTPTASTHRSRRQRPLLVATLVGIFVLSALVLWILTAPAADEIGISHPQSNATKNSLDGLAHRQHREHQKPPDSTKVDDESTKQPSRNYAEEHVGTGKPPGTGNALPEQPAVQSDANHRSESTADTTSSAANTNHAVVLKPFLRSITSKPPNAGRPTGLAVSPGGTNVFLATSSGVLYRVTANDRRRMASFAEGTLVDVVTGESHGELLVGVLQSDGAVSTFSMSGEQKHSTKLPESCTRIVADGELDVFFALTLEGAVVAVDRNSGEVREWVPPWNGETTAIQLSNHYNSLLLGTEGGEVWTLDAQALIAGEDVTASRLIGPSKSPVYACASDGSGYLCVTGSSILSTSRGESTQSALPKELDFARSHGVAISSDFAACAYLGGVALVSRGGVVRRAAGGRAAATVDVAVDASSSSIASVDHLLRVTVWNQYLDEVFAQGAEAKPFQHYAAVGSLAFDDQGEYCLSSDRTGRVVLWDVNQGVAVKELSVHSGIIVDCELFTLGDERLFAAMCGADGRAWVWDVTNDALHATLTVDSTFAHSVDVNLAVTELAICDAGGRVHFWDVTDWTYGGAIDASLHGAKKTVFYVNDHDFVVTDGWKTMRFSDKSARPQWTLDSPYHAPQAVSSDGQMASISKWDDDEATIVVVQTSSLPDIDEVRYTFHRGDSGAGVLALSGTGRVLVSESDLVVLTPHFAGEQVIAVDDLPVAATFSKDGSVLALGFQDGAVSFYRP